LKKNGRRSAPQQPERASEATPVRQDAPRGQAWYLQPITTYVLGASYLLVAAALLLLTGPESASVGAVCGNACGGTALLGISLEWWGAGLMSAVLVLRWLSTQRLDIALRQLTAMTALLHAGSSCAFAASQWIGFVDVCPLCQVASLLSVAVAASCLGVVRQAFAAPLLPALQSLALGVAIVGAMWPFLDGVHAGQPSTNIAVSNIPTTPTAKSELDEVMDAMVIGSADAPYELVMLSDFDCPICQRFEQQQLPTLIREGVETGRIRVRFLLSRRNGAASGPYNELSAATSLALAGMPADQTLKLMRQGALVSSPQGIARAEDETLRDQGMLALHRVNSGVTWPAVIAEHERRARLLRERYFPGRNGTPAFVVTRGAMDFDNLPPADSANVLALYGFQLAESFVEFAKEG
jgi:hypothetical protein